MSLGTKGLIGLAAGLICGAAIAASGNLTLVGIGDAVELIGKLWINAILMTIVPLVFAKLFVSIAAADDAHAIGKAGKRAAVIFIALLTVTATIAALAMPVVFAHLPIDGGPSATATITEPPKASEWIVAMIPTNAIKAAADGATVPLLVFAIAFAFGATRIGDLQRRTLVQFFQSVDTAISVVLRWIVAFSPYGVFALEKGMIRRS